MYCVLDRIVHFLKVCMCQVKLQLVIKVEVFNERFFAYVSNVRKAI